MRCVIQRTLKASVSVDDQDRGSIDRGLVVLAGIESVDSPSDWEWMAEKIAHLRIFPDNSGKMNLSILDVIASRNTDAESIGILAIPNFTVAGDARKGRRPSFDGAMQPPDAQQAFDLFVRSLCRLCPVVEQGVFGADMQVHLVNDGPVTLVLESPARIS